MTCPKCDDKHYSGITWYPFDIAQRKCLKCGTKYEVALNEDVFPEGLETVFQSLTEVTQ